MPDDNLKDQRAAYEFFREKFRTQDAFTKGELQAQTSWTWKSTTDYWSKQYEPFAKEVAPVLTGVAQKDQKYRVTRAFLPFGSWTKFRRHVSQKRRLTFEYSYETFDTVLLFDFFLPLTNETVLRLSLDSLFYRDALQKQLLGIGIATLREHFPTEYFHELVKSGDGKSLDGIVYPSARRRRGRSVVIFTSHDDLDPEAQLGTEGPLLTLDHDSVTRLRRLLTKKS